MSKRAYTWEEVTNTPLGRFKVGDREFVDRHFTRKEKREILERISTAEGAPEVAFVVTVLNALHDAEHQVPVTPDWLDEHLSDEGLSRVLRRLAERVGVTLNDPA